ncbi:MAG TPA: PAS domain S-box protein [Verrucomicrobiae bacterium]|nr:PAS domain S-box protein [Verrucomicrobiae bacterium]
MRRHEPDEEREAESLRSRLAAVVESSDDAIITKTLDGIVTTWNRAAQRIFGYTADEMIGKPITVLIPPERLHEERLILGKISSGEPVDHYETIRRRKDGTLIHISLSVSPLKDSRGAIVGASKIARDITDRKRTEEELAHRIRLTTARADVSAAMATSDDLGLVLQRCTEALVKNFGAAFARIWTVNADDNVLELQASAGVYTHLDGPHSRVKIGDYKIGRIAKGNQPHMTNDVQHDPNISDPDWARKEGMVAFAGYPLTVKDRVLGVIAMFARETLADDVLKEMGDIADVLAQWLQRRQAELALREARETLSRHTEDLERQVTERTATLRETVGELEAFSYSISHDLRAPLRAMQSFAVILGQEFGDKLGAEGQEYIRRITTAAERMDNLIRDVLNYSRVARTDLMLEPVNVEKLLRDILESYPGFQAPTADIQLEGAFPAVIANGAVLTQCISNLLGNAVKFVKPGMTPRVRVRAETSGDGKTVRLFVKDNGLGIEKAAHGKIFGIFERLSTRYEGTGIGLAIVKKGIERMAGRVGVESEPGVGSTFWLELPRAQPEASDVTNQRHTPEAA